MLDNVRDELRLLVGESIILFQRYEYTFKSLLTLSLVEGTKETVQSNFSNRFEKISKKSLGQLIGQYIEDVVISEDMSDVIDDTEIDSVHISMRVTIEHQLISRAEIEAKYKSLVDARNFVVHNLISELVPDDEASYQRMIVKLEKIKEEFERDLQNLIKTVQSIREGYRYILESDELAELIRTKRS